MALLNQHVRPITPHMEGPEENNPRQAYVNQLYLDLFQRGPTSSELNGWVSLLAKGLAREQMVSSLITFNPYHIHILELDRPVGDLYLRFFDRPPTAGESQYYQSLRQSGESMLQIITAMLSSPEYYQIAISDSYQRFFGRNP